MSNGSRVCSVSIHRIDFTFVKYWNIQQQRLQRKKKQSWIFRSAESTRINYEMSSSSCDSRRQRRTFCVEVMCTITIWQYPNIRIANFIYRIAFDVIFVANKLKNSTILFCWQNFLFGPCTLDHFSRTSIRFKQTSVDKIDENVAFGSTKTNVDIAVVVQTHAGGEWLHQHFFSSNLTIDIQCNSFSDLSCIFPRRICEKFLDGCVESTTRRSNSSKCPTSNGSHKSLNAAEHCCYVCAATRGMGGRTHGKVPSHSWAWSEYIAAHCRPHQICAKSERNRHRCAEAKCHYRGQCDTQHRWSTLSADFGSISL